LLHGRDDLDGHVLTTRLERLGATSRYEVDRDDPCATRRGQHGPRETHEALAEDGEGGRTDAS
jgi:hypothetical protein